MNIYNDVQLSGDEQNQLVCRYRRHRPIFYIRPLKEEMVNIDPKVVIFHDVITDSEIAKIKELATPMVRTFTVKCKQNMFYLLFVY